MCNILIDVLPTEVEIDGKMYAINSDFRTSMLFELLMQSNASDYDKAVNALMLYYPELPENGEEAIEKILWFYGCGDKPKPQKRQIRKSEDDSEEEPDEESEEEEDSAPNDRIYSFEYDAEYIYAAYLQQYGIDLQDIEYLHWWKFRAMFKSLDEKCEFVKIMGYRATKIDDKMSDREKAFLRKMKKAHELPRDEEEVAAENALRQAIMNGDDISHLLNGGS